MLRLQILQRSAATAPLPSRKWGRDVCGSWAHGNKSRALTCSQTYGQCEVFGYLGVWLAASDRDIAAHMSYKPQLHEIHKWLVDHGYPVG